MLARWPLRGGRRCPLSVFSPCTDSKGFPNLDHRWQPSRACLTTATQKQSNRNPRASTMSIAMSNPIVGGSRESTTVTPLVRSVVNAPMNSRDDHV